MANISSAFGTFHFEDGFDLAQKQNFVQVMGVLAKCYFGTHLSINDEAKGVGIDDDSLAFTGNGRWVYENNLENMHNWLVQELDDKLLKVYHELLNYMSDDDQGIMVEYVDDEFGCEVLYEAEGVLKAYPFDDGVALKYESGSCENYDYTRSNLQALNVYDVFECMEADVTKQLVAQGYDITAKILDDLTKKLENNPFIEVDDAVAEIRSMIDGQVDETLTTYLPGVAEFVPINDEAVIKHVQQEEFSLE